MPAFFDHKLNVRIREEELADIENLISRYPDRYDRSISNFIRVAIIREIKRGKENDGTKVFS